MKIVFLILNNILQKKDGGYRIKAFINGKLIKGSPFNIEVKPGADITKTIIKGLGLKSGLWPNKIAEFVVQQKIKKANHV